MLARAMADVVPLADRDRLPAAPSPGVAADRSAAAPRAGFIVEHDDGGVSGRAPGVNGDLVRALRKGHFPPAARLDLHGRRAGDVGATLDRFLASARATGHRCVAIVHGRGSHAADGVAALRDAVIAHLGRPQSGALVTAFASAPAGEGGDGATWVLLRETSR